MNFDQAFDKLLGNEGGYSDHRADPGGKTNFGITIAVARENGYFGDMRNMPLSFAKTVYRRQYWDAVRADELPSGIRYAVFDAAVNSGPRQAVKWLQEAIGAVQDGLIGGQTISMSRAAAPDFALRRMMGARLKFMTDLKIWPSFSRGWARRIADLLEA